VPYLGGYVLVWMGVLRVRVAVPCCFLILMVVYAVCVGLLVCVAVGWGYVENRGGYPSGVVPGSDVFHLDPHAPARRSWSSPPLATRDCCTCVLLFHLFAVVLFVIRTTLEGEILILVGTTTEHTLNCVHAQFFSFLFMSLASFFHTLWSFYSFYVLLVKDAGEKKKKKKKLRKTKRVSCIGREVFKRKSVKKGVLETFCGRVKSSTMKLVQWG